MASRQWTLADRHKLVTIAYRRRRINYHDDVLGPYLYCHNDRLKPHWNRYWEWVNGFAFDNTARNAARARASDAPRLPGPDGAAQA